MRGATWFIGRRRGAGKHFNPRTPCGVRPPPVYHWRIERLISIHAPHAGCDVGARFGGPLPAAISIHAPHAGCDLINAIFTVRHVYFNPRTPCGVRHTEKGIPRTNSKISIHAPHAGCDALNSSHSLFLHLFQSTHPMRGATSK